MGERIAFELRSAPMARIRTALTDGRPVIVVSGRLTAADMGRFEHACAPALTAHPLLLEIDVRDVTYFDSTAEAVLGRMAARGAVLTRDDPGSC